MKKLDKNYYSTYDLGLSSALISAGFELASLDKTNPHKVQFIFKTTTDIDKTINDYWSNSLKIRARTFFDTIKMLKNRIYSE